ncbi:hypothetical protein ABMA27_015880 [Loxostege sticticalis]|uniref:Protein lava lamp-like n=1 Tax=Loxostege sticticalis TaxID=481309 RepID=A0ABR3I4R1_LOXSC
MADDKKVDKSLEGEPLDDVDTNIAVSSSEVCSVAGSVKTSKTQRMSSSSDRQVKFERAQKALENAALVSKRIKEHRKATAELLGRPFEEDDIGDAAEMASTVSERTGYSVATDTSTNISVQDALNIPGISESLANTLKQKELLMERIKQYKEISKRPIKTSAIKKEPTTDFKTDLKKIQKTDNSDVTQLLNTIKDKENALSVIQVKMKAMETTILDLQEKINEKDQIIEAKNMATTLMSDSLSKKEKDSLLLLEDTRQQMTKMQENFISMETEWKEEKQRLMKEIELKDEKISNLEEANTILENSRFEITVAHSKLLEELDLKNKQISELEETIKNLSADQTTEGSPKEKEDFEEEKGSLEISQMVELSKKVELLEQINCQIRQTNIELENKLAAVNTEPKVAGASSSPSKKASPVPGRKGRNTASKMKSPWSNLSSESLSQEPEKKGNKNEITKLEMLVQSLNKDILEKEYMISQKDTLISELQSLKTVQETTIEDLKSAQIKSSADVVHVGVITEPEETEAKNVDAEKVKDAHEPTLLAAEQILDVQELEEKLKAAQQQIIALNEEVDLANKNMVKVKSGHKLKLKQMQKTIDNFSKVSDSNAEIVKLNEEMHQLTQKVAELEEEKGNLQLHLVDYDSGRLTESDVYKKMIEMENLAETRLKAISMLEAQKFDLVQELHVLQQKNMEMEDKLADMSQLQSEQVCSEMKSVQLEEQIDELTASRKESELIIENLKLDKEHLNSTIKIIQDEKDELVHKLESYIQENMELTDKLEKLSTEKVSSAESIEIVESLTTQEKLELEEYNKGMADSKSNPNADRYKDDAGDNEKSIEILVEQAAELNKKIELFNLERQEVMDKMNKINAENEMLHDNIAQLNSQCGDLQSNIDLLTNEKQELLSLNAELNSQIEDLKRERVEIVKEAVEVPKPSAIEETLETAADTQQDDKSAGEKGVNRNKSVKQLTKEILKLKNTIKDREAEIADCQMKILSLEERHQKQNELLQSNASYEAKLKLLAEENQSLKEKLELSVSDNQSVGQLEELKHANELLQDELQKTRQEYSNTVSARDMRLHELEKLLREYENQIFNYGNTLQQKDKEMVEYINQITKLNDVSQKLKSTIEVLEEEKAKDQSAELVKSLNKQISVYQKKLTECEEKLKSLEEEKSQLLSIKSTLENKNISIETELKKSQDLLAENQTIMKELQAQQQKHSEEVANVMRQATERDQEIHEIKLQLRKESIENEKLRNLLAEKDKSSEEYSHVMQDTTDKINKLSTEKEHLSEQCLALEGKNKELMEKLKKFAVNIKKKSSMYTELETQFHEVQQQLEAKVAHLEQLSIQVETLPALQEKLKHAEEEINRLQTQKVSMEQQKTEMKGDIEYFADKLSQATEEIANLNDTINGIRKELNEAHEDNVKLKSQIDLLNKKHVEHEIEQKNNMNLITKISSLEADNNQKQAQIVELLHKLENQEQTLTQLQFGHDAKVQERDLYIETLETEINKYKTRICRLEESISIMEDRRHSLERKADQLDVQLQEKQKAYSDYSSQEDELVSRLAVLMDHDRVVEKQLHEIERENRHLQDKIQHLTEENNHLRKSLAEVQDNYNTIIDKANRTDAAENAIVKLQTEVRDLDTQLKRVTQEHQAMILKKKQDIEDLESEFNTQIENAIKEKKALSEKYEKITDHITQLEMKLQEYRSENERLKINMEELNRINQDILDKSSLQQQQASPDYTDQYISEINRLNSLVNNRNHEIQELNNKLHSYQVNGAATVSNLEGKINDLTNKLQQSTSDVDQLINEIQILKQDNEQLQITLVQKEEQFNELKDRKKVTFEMNIPKTEGLVISSTIEAVNTEDPAKLNISELESQIISDVSSNYSDTKPSDSKTTEALQKNTYVVGADVADSKNVSEELIVPKKAYLCYKGEQDENNPSETDPFNSDEGWGFGETEETPSDVIPGLSHLNEQIKQLEKENDSLKKELDLNNTKLMKVMKKLKELKNNNEMLSNELKLSKQLSQSSFLDSAIEDELRSNISELEKKVEELNADLQKEKREKETIKKQNEVFNNANERLTDMKEKLDNEIELWKFKFKEVNDKMSTLQWGADNKDSPQHKVSASHVDVAPDSAKNEIDKLEKENDELQSMVDQLTTQNRELLSLETKLRSDIDSITQQMKQQQICKNCESLNDLVTQLKETNATLSSKKETINKKLEEFEARYSEAIQVSENLKLERDELMKLYENDKIEFAQKCTEFENELQILKHSENEAKINVESLKLELENSHQQLSYIEVATNRDEAVRVYGKRKQKDFRYRIKHYPKLVYLN